MTRPQRIIGELCALAACATPISGAFASDQPGRKLGRQISVFEQILDRVLIESPNFLISSRDNSRGMYVECYGAIFSFRASLVEKFDWNGGEWPWGSRIEIDDDNHVTIRPGHRRDDETSGEEEERGRDQADENEDGGGDSSGQAKEKRLYEHGKQELAEALLDYGDTLSALSDDQWVAIVGLLEDSAYFMDNRISRLVVRARLGDLRRYGEGDLDEEAMQSRIEIMEF